MKQNAPARWLPGRRFLFQGGGIAALVGILLALLSGIAAGRLAAGNLLLGGAVGLSIFVLATLFMVALLPWLDRLRGVSKALAIGATLFAAGALGSVLVIALVDLARLGRVRLSGSEAAWSLGFSGAVGVLVGSFLYVWEEARQRLEHSISRLKEAEFAERELALARSLQQRLLPDSELEGEGYRIAARNRPALYVAGDYYDVFPLAERGLGLVVGDVAGKGIGASLMMATAKAMLPLIAAGLGVEETLRELNRRLGPELAPREFVALCFALFDPGSGQVRLGNAGLPDPYLLRPGRPAEPLAVPGPRLPLGVRPEVPYESRQVSLAPGDRLLLLTDGPPEAPTADGSPLGYEAFGSLLPGPAAEPGLWLDGLLARVDGATAGPLSDDWTLLLLERRGP